MEQQRTVLNPIIACHPGPTATAECCIAVNPAAPMAIASRIVKLNGTEISQSAGTRAF